MKATAFYSYKGGLGRTLLLAWTARALDQLGHKVVALDMDLEAPGLPFKLGFDDRDDLGPGLIDLLLRFQRGESPPESIEPWLRPVSGTKHLKVLSAGPAPAGSYWQQLNKVRWKDLFFGPEAGGARFAAWLRESIEAATGADHLLIDSRTGVTDLGSAVLALLSDQVVALMGTSPEGLYGTRAVLRALASSRATDGLDPIPVRAVLSRLPAGSPPSQIEDMRNAVKNALTQETTRLAEVFSLDAPLVLFEESAVLINEQDALVGKAPRLEAGYSDVLRWVDGGEGVICADQVPSPHDRPRSSDAIAIGRRLVEEDRDRHLPGLVGVLNREAAILAEAGRLAEGLKLQEEAIGHLRSLSMERPEAFMPDLAMSLNNLSNRLGGLGRREAALEAIEEAVALYRQLAQARPEAFTPDLAMSLNNLSNQLGGLGRRESALETIEEAVALYRQLAQTRPEAFTPDLATSLNNLSNHLDGLGRREEALETVEEAVALYRQLAQTRPEAFTPDLAGSLAQRAIILRGADQDEEALGSVSEAIRLYRPFFLAHPAAFRTRTVAMFKLYSSTAQELGREVDSKLVGPILAVLQSQPEDAGGGDSADSAE
ncbi:KGGVGR-motif variant AAA ATPase [Engelhardtia mirabilis]|uniref:Tetratricopeptide repeat protein n=1 Tax=Engelhardtia mirabilis TaxID=2528011 RepID=A0A518BR34_9BACT|nr:Tetratricopeptide repeat protein [Planctomycetes bacterium Pla133]QDV03769.1 Tetratricopeptide repeat protein [Planctomycetes bacterium Pla86]